MKTHQRAPRAQRTMVGDYFRRHRRFRHQGEGIPGVIRFGSHTPKLASAWLDVGAAFLSAEALAKVERRDGWKDRGIKPLLQNAPELAPRMLYSQAIGQANA